MVQAVGRRVFNERDNAVSASYLVQTAATWVKAEISRNAWPDHGLNEVVRVIVDVKIGDEWQEVGSFSTAGGTRHNRFGDPVAVSSATFNRRLPAGCLLLVKVEAKKDGIDAGVELTWG